MATPHHHNAGSGCFSGILRRILCKDGLQTHPSDDVAESKPNSLDLVKDTKTEAKPIQAPASTPGVVARLMGLESLPDSSINRVPSGPDSVSRSRSVNFMDYMLKFDFAQSQQQHRRVRSSVSFREVATTPPLPRQNEVFVLYLDNVAEKKKVRSKPKKLESGSQTLKQSKQEQSKLVRAKAVVKKEKVSKLKDEPRRVSVRGSCNGGGKDLSFVTPSKKDISRKPRPPTKPKAPTKLVNQKNSVIELEPIKKKRNHRDFSVQKTEQDQCSSVDSSPVSVLDLSETLFSEDSFPDPEKKSKWSEKITDVNEYKFPFPTHIPVVEEAIIKNNDSGFACQETEYLMELRSKLCRLAEEDVEESKWSVNEEIEDVCVEIGGQIVDQLLRQVVDELVLISF